jgi:hypothetical protein
MQSSLYICVTTFLRTYVIAILSFRSGEVEWADRLVFNGLREPQSLLGVLQKCYTMLSCSEVPLTIGGFLRARLSAAAMQFGARLTNAATLVYSSRRSSTIGLGYTRRNYRTCM